MTSPRIVLLHATTVAIGAIAQAFATLWPEAETVNLLDDSLSFDRAREDTLSERMIDRFVTFGRYAAGIGADGVLVTCSAFGPAIERLAGVVQVPVVKPNEAMFEAALASGKRIGMLATFKPSIATMEEEFADFVLERQSSAVLKTILVEEAMESLRRGDTETHNRLLAERAADLAEMDVVMLAHFSTAIAAKQVGARIAAPVLTAPDAAVQRMRAALENAGP